jgi:3-hydroxy-3-methylglutaryl CoA synthase
MNFFYSSIAALVNAIDLVESNPLDGRNIVASAGDITIYTEGGAYPTGGFGAYTVFIGRNDRIQSLNISIAFNASLRVFT